MSRLCIFCSRQVRTRSKEHMVPEWLWKYVGMTKISMIRSVHKGRTGPLDSNSFVIRDLPDKGVGGFVEGRVCTQCNTGWMSNLENAVKPLLIPILNEPTLIDEWPFKKRQVLAQWVVKTSLVAISRSVVLTNVPNDHFISIRRGVISEGISVFGGYHFMGDKGFSYQAGKKWDVDMPAKVPKELKDDIWGAAQQHCYKVCLQFRSLLLMAAFSPTPQFVLFSDESTHQLIWTERPIKRLPRHPFLTGRPFGMMLASDDARRRFADLLRIDWVPLP
jgi:hypothetical protein